MRLFLLLLFIIFTNTLKSQSLNELVKALPNLEGKKEYLNSPFATTGDRLYVIGHQNGQFPDLGWHISGEMGGVWAHPIKLLDGFIVSIDGQDLTNAETFINFPMANQHRFQTKNFIINRFQFVPDGIAGCIIEFEIENKTNQAINTPFVFQTKSDLRPTWLADKIKIEDFEDKAHFQNGRWIFQDTKNPWFAVVGSNQNGLPGAAPIPFHSIGRGFRIHELPIEHSRQRQNAYSILHCRFSPIAARRREKLFENQPKTSIVI